jgi:uncharacterized protein (TIGR02588 family)
MKLPSALRLRWPGRLPAHSSRVGALFFTQDPHQFQLQLRAQGYIEP